MSYRRGRGRVVTIVAIVLMDRLQAQYIEEMPGKMCSAL